MNKTGPTILVKQDQTIDQVFQAQKATALLWRNSTVDERSQHLKKLKTWILQNKKLIQEVLYEDFKKPFVETDLSELFPVVSEINHALKNLKSWMAPQKTSTTLPMLGTSGKILYEPKGVSLIIGPWNYPFNLTIGPLVSALAAGCPAILKPSEHTPKTSQLIDRMISELFQASEVAVFQGGADIAQSLLALPFDHIFFTGSPQVGKLVMQAAGKNLSSVTLELGGKSPVIVSRDADLKDAAEKLVAGKFINAGQTCVAPDYVFAHSEIKDHLQMELKSALQRMYDPNYEGIDKSPDLARIVNEKNFLRLVNLLEDAKAKGATVEFGGNSNAGEKYIDPTLLTGLHEDMDIMQEEIFGPVLPILEYTELATVIDYINRKPKALALYFFGNDAKERNIVLQQTSSGNAVINDCVIHFLHPNLPFGGVNNSGIGSAHGHFGFLAFSHQKGVLTQRTGYTNASLLRPPYRIPTRKIIDKMIKWF